MKRYIVIALAAFATAYCAIGAGNADVKHKMDDEKYNLTLTIGLMDGTSMFVYQDMSVEGAPDSVLTGIKSLPRTFTLKEAVRQLDSINLALWDYRGDGKGVMGPLRTTAVLNAVNGNNAAFSVSMANYLSDKADELDKNTDNIKSIVNAFGVTSARDIKNSAIFKKESSEYLTANSGVINNLTDSITSLQNQIKNAASGTDITSLQNQVNELQNRLVQYSLSSAAANDSLSTPFFPISISPVSTADRNFTNAMERLSAYLGAVSDETDKNDGLNFMPPKVDGDTPATIDQWLSWLGAVGLATNEETKVFNSSFIAENGNVTAPFNAPSNWADGKTIIVTNGCFAMRSTSAWAYYDGAFHNCEVQVGSATINESAITYTTAGPVYAIVTYGGSSGSTMSLSPTANAVFGESVAFKVGELVAAENGDLYSIYQPSGRFVITCYE